MRFLPGVPFQTRNVNRTSEPGLVANEIVPPPRGMRSMSSAFRHFINAHECKVVARQVLQICLSGCESRRGCHFKAHVAQQQRHDVGSVASAGSAPKRVIMRCGADLAQWQEPQLPP